MALPPSCCAVCVPYYEGYNRFAVWPSPSLVSLNIINKGLICLQAGQIQPLATVLVRISACDGAMKTTISMQAQLKPTFGKFIKLGKSEPQPLKKIINGIKCMHINNDKKINMFAFRVRVSTVCLIRRESTSQCPQVKMWCCLITGDACMLLSRHWMTTL